MSAGTREPDDTDRGDSIITKYLPVVTVEHDPLTGAVRHVDIEWTESQTSIEQAQPDGEVLEEVDAAGLASMFDAWLDEVTDAPTVSAPGVWCWIERDDG